ILTRRYISLMLCKKKKVPFMRRLNCKQFHRLCGLERLGSANNLQNLFGDGSLTSSIVSQSQLFQKLAGIFRSLVHSSHPGSVLSCIRVKKSFKKLDLDCFWNNSFQNLLLLRLVDIIYLIFFHLTYGSRTDRQQ